MKHRFYLSLAATALAAVACNNGEDTAAKTTTDTVTVTKTDSVVKEAPKVDSAAIYAYYDSVNAKSAAKKTHKTATAKKKGKTLEVEADEQVVTYDAPAPTPPPPTAQPAAKPQPTKVVVVHDKEMYYYIPNEKASYPGGEAAFNKYIASHVEYPERAATYNVSGVVYASITLDELGKVEKVDFPGHHLGYGLEEEAGRVLMSSPRWNPAKVNGQPVKARFTVPIHFKMS